MSSLTQSLFTFAFAVEQSQLLAESAMTASNTLPIDEDVVDALSFMHEGSPLILIENGDYIKFTTYYLTSDNTSIVDEDENVIFPLAAVESVSQASETAIEDAFEVLEMTEMRSEGLEPILFSVTMLGGHETIVVADSPQSSYIWMQGMEALIESTNDLSIIPLKVSDDLRSGTLIIGNPNNLPDEDEDEEETVERMSHRGYDGQPPFFTKHNVVIPPSLVDEWQYFERQIDAANHFAQTFCILGTTEHLDMLSDALRLQDRLYDLESRIYEKNQSYQPFISWNEWPDIYVQWWTLHADLMATKLHTFELRQDLGLKH